MDPFVHHPELRGKVADPVASVYRTLSLESVAQMMIDHDLPSGWWFSDAERLALLDRFLATHDGGDLWVFAYGSLMWDPALIFDEVRRARVPNYARRFILRDIYGGRGRPEQPGLMAALDTCPTGTCDGIVFRIAAHRVRDEAAVLFQREMIAPAYVPRMVDTMIEGQTIKSLAFVADHQAELIDATMTRAEQIACLVSGRGVFGSSFEYLQNVVRGLADFGIEDADASDLLREALAAR